jgi:endogenous inhibitor of DNA gyrase (YacG/DUF329 family)
MPAKTPIPIIRGAFQACPECAALMRMVKTGPYRPNHSIPVKEALEERTFECPECRHSESWVFTGL